MMGIFDFFKKKKKSNDFEEEGVDEEQKTYTSKITGDTYSGESLKNLIEFSEIKFPMIKIRAEEIKKSGKATEMTKRLKFYDWEGIKSIMKEDELTKDNKLILMNIETIAFCEYDFGTISTQLGVALIKYAINELDEEELDRRFFIQVSGMV